MAAQVAAALAISAKVSREHNSGDYGAAVRWLQLAERAYNYAKLGTNAFGANATCTFSTAASNCLGTGCETVDENGLTVEGVRLFFLWEDASIAPRTCLIDPREAPQPRAEQSSTVVTVAVPADLHAIR